jgi:hypothetical protein
MQNQNEFIADKVFPNVPVTKKSDSYFVYPKGQWFRTDAKKRAPSTESAGSGYEISTDTYSAEVQALHKDVDDQIRSNVDQPINLDAEATEFVTRGILLRKEKDFAARYMTTGLWTGAADYTPAILWDAANAIPIKNIRAKMSEIKLKTGFKPNTMVLSEDAWNAVQDSADFLDRFAMTERKIMTTDLLANVLGLEKVLIGGAVENTANEGAAPTMARLFAKDCLLVYAAPRPSLLLPSGGYTFSWTGYLGASANGTRIKRFRMEPIASDRVEGEMAFDMKLVASDLGCFFNNVIS